MSCSGSETSTDISMSSLENLSTSARQEPQGEETADLTSGLLDSSASSSVCAVEADTKSSPWQNDPAPASNGLAGTPASGPSAASQQPEVGSNLITCN